MKEMMSDKKKNNPSPSRGAGGVLIIDNYDSFTYNLVHLVNELGVGCEVWRNDKFAIDDVDAFEHIILSFVPAHPSR